LTIAIIVHGGAKEIAPDEVEANKAGCLAALNAGWAVLHRGGDALEAVEAAVRVLEDDPTFNAACGATLNADGDVELDAGIMQSKGLQCGAVAAVHGVRHPISVARLILDKQTILLAGPNAERFAREQGAELCDPHDLIIEKQRQAWEQKQKSLDTVGCVALDSKGVLAAGTSTGGETGKQPGRVGDSPLVGCGLYAEEGRGACSMTGSGEAIIQVSLSRRATDLLADHDPEEAARKAIELLTERVGGEGGCILLDQRGRIGWAHNTRDMACAYRSEDMDTPAVFTRKKG
jgi:L-asparaginase / beta-aspartyl-peptidase